MSYQPLLDAWHDSQETRTPLRPTGYRRGRWRWASLEHAVAGGHHRGDGVGIADTTPGRARGPRCVDNAERQDTEQQDTERQDTEQHDGEQHDGEQHDGEHDDQEVNQEVDEDEIDEDEEPAA